MAKQNRAGQWQRADEEVRRRLPPDGKLVRTLRGHTGLDGRMLASPSDDKTIRPWDTETGVCAVSSPAFVRATGKSPEPADRNVCPTSLAGGTTLGFATRLCWS